MYEDEADLTHDAEQIGASGFFDDLYYQRQRIDLLGVADCKRHYLLYGWREQLDPGPRFDTSAYVAAYADVRESGMNPLVHFLRHGKHEGRLAFVPAHEAARGALAVAAAPPAEQWDALPPPRGEPPLVDVVIPVYRGFAETLRCIYSVLAAPVRTPYEVWVVDDASPEPELAAALDELARAGRIRLFRNPSNAGFVRSCNFAMRLHPHRDVVLLNADTEVFGDWLDRLRAAAAQQNVGAVSPFSNNAEICSYPFFTREHAYELEVSDAELDGLFAATNRGAVVDLPTAVGFCLYLRRECLNTVGLFDEERFGLGYGEENDLCRRAWRVGWRSVLAADVFVRHYGGVSFGAAKAQLVAAATETVTELHPDYLDEVSRFVARDPAAPYRRGVDLARIRRATDGITFLFVTHDRGGGTERHALELAGRIGADGARVVFAKPDAAAGELRLEIPDLVLPNVGTIDVTGDTGEFVAIAAALGVAHLHVQHLVDLPPQAAEFFRTAARRLGIRYDVTVHDYFFVCPRITLIDASGFYCGEPDESECERCVTRTAEPAAMPIREWRARYERFLHGARKVFVPNGDVARRLGRYFPLLACTLRPHPEAAPPPVVPRIAGRDDVVPRTGSPPRRRVGIIGYIGPHKGSRLLLACAVIARDRGLPLEFVVIGTTDINHELREAGVTITGAYAERDLAQLIADARIDLAWFASVWPETYSYTLSAALQARVFPVAFDLGAIAARLRALGWGHLMPIETFFQAERIVDELAGVTTTTYPGRTLETAAHASPGFVAEYYELAPETLAPAREPLTAE